jgi:hypothetical protein
MIAQNKCLASARFPLSPWGEGWGEGVVSISPLHDGIFTQQLAPSPGADAEARFQFGHSGRAGLSTSWRSHASHGRGEAKQDCGA